MLVLSRKAGQSVVINNNITLTIVEIRGDKVRLGFEAPIEIPIHRHEVNEAIHQENREAIHQENRDKRKTKKW